MVCVVLVDTNKYKQITNWGHIYTVAVWTFATLLDLSNCCCGFVVRTIGTIQFYDCLLIIVGTACCVLIVAAFIIYCGLPLICVCVCGQKYPRQSA